MTLIKPIHGVVFTECGNDHLDWYEEYYLLDERCDWYYVGVLFYNEPPKTEAGSPRPYGHFGREQKIFTEDLYLSGSGEIPANTATLTILYPIARPIKE